MIEAVYRTTGEDAQLIRQFMETTQGLPFGFERDLMRTVIAAADGNQEAWAIIRVTVLKTEIEALPPETQETVLQFMDLLQEAERAGISLPPVPAVGEEARA